MRCSARSERKSSHFCSNGLVPIEDFRPTNLPSNPHRVSAPKAEISKWFRVFQLRTLSRQDADCKVCLWQLWREGAKSKESRTRDKTPITQNTIPGLHVCISHFVLLILVDEKYQTQPLRWPRARCTVALPRARPTPRPRWPRERNMGAFLYDKTFVSK